jgi:hypothetical protein
LNDSFFTTIQPAESDEEDELEEDEFREDIDEERERLDSNLKFGTEKKLKLKMLIDRILYHYYYFLQQQVAVHQCRLRYAQTGPSFRCSCYHRMLCSFPFVGPSHPVHDVSEHRCCHCEHCQNLEATKAECVNKIISDEISICLKAYGWHGIYK